jgi:hypothetical protein
MLKGGILTQEAGQKITRRDLLDKYAEVYVGNQKSWRRHGTRLARLCDAQLAPSREDDGGVVKIRPNTRQMLAVKP